MKFLSLDGVLYVNSRGSPIRIFGADHGLLEAVSPDTDHRLQSLFEAFYLSCSIIIKLYLTTMYIKHYI